MHRSIIILKERFFIEKELIFDKNTKKYNFNWVNLITNVERDLIIKKR
jgi:hypothetical protein